MFAIFNVSVRYFVRCIELHITPVFLYGPKCFLSTTKPIPPYSPQYGGASSVVLCNMFGPDSGEGREYRHKYSDYHPLAGFTRWARPYSLVHAPISGVLNCPYASIERNPYGDTRIRIQTVAMISFHSCSSVSFRSSRTNHSVPPETAACPPIKATRDHCSAYAAGSSINPNCRNECTSV